MHKISAFAVSIVVTASALFIASAIAVPRLARAIPEAPPTTTALLPRTGVFDVPFYSQFRNISAQGWRKVGCGVTSLAMIIEFYKPGKVSVDTLLREGIASGAYLKNAGWIHKGLALLSEKYGLKGTIRDLSSSGMDIAFAQLKTSLKQGPVIASVYYTFDPKSPIPHLVVVSGVKNGTVYYNDPAGGSGGGTISENAFKRAWKKRYIEIRPATAPLV